MGRVRNPGTLELATMDELVQEIQRRSLVCLVTAMTVQEGGDQWHTRVHGSPMLCGTASAVMSMKLAEWLNKPGAGRPSQPSNGETGEPDYGDTGYRAEG